VGKEEGAVEEKRSKPFDEIERGVDFCEFEKKPVNPNRVKSLVEVEENARVIIG
jgi:hypothetical protein